MEIRGVGRSYFFFDLQEKRIAGTVAFKIDAVIAQAHRTRADHLEGDIDRTVVRK